MKKINIDSLEYKDIITKTIKKYNENDKQTIIFSIDTYFPIIDGVVNVVHNFSKKLKDKYNIIVCCPSIKNETIVDDYLVIACKSIFINGLGYSLPLPTTDKFFKNSINSLKKVKLIHCHSPFNIGRYLLKFSQRNNIPFICTFHSQYKKDIYKNTKSFLMTNIIWKYIYYIFKNSILVTTMHEYSKRLLISYGYKGRIELIANGTDFKPLKISDKSIIDKYNLNNPINKLIFVGRLIKNKRILFIVDVCKILKEKGFDFKMYFIGDGPNKKSLIKRIKKYNLENQIILVGKINEKKEIQTFYKECDLLVFPSTYDVSSIVQLEASSQSLPGIFIKDSVTSCNITDNETGFISEDDPNLFAMRIIEIFKEKEIYNNVSINTFKKLYKNWDDIIKKIDELYSKL